jgi:hypothetical protein
VYAEAAAPRPRGAWARTPTGWALNLDGTPASGFSLPRLEIEQSARGWLCRCRLADGTSTELTTHADSIAVAQRTAAELARDHIGGEWRAAVDALLQGH